MACSSSTTTEPAEFIVRIDSVAGPNAVSGGVTIHQWLWGTVGPGGCTALKEIQSTRVASNRLELTVIGEHVSGATCLSTSTTLSGMVIDIAPPVAYDFNLIVHEPDGSTLTRRIYGE